MNRKMKWNLKKLNVTLQIRNILIEEISQKLTKTRNIEYEWEIIKQCITDGKETIHVENNWKHVKE